MILKTFMLSQSFAELSIDIYSILFILFIYVLISRKRALSILVYKFCKRSMNIKYFNDQQLKCFLGFLNVSPSLYFMIFDKCRIVGIHFRGSLFQEAT